MVLVMLDWKRAAADAIRSGDYVIVREQLFGETAYLAIHGGKTLAVSDDAQSCREACAAHAVGRDVEVDVRNSQREMKQC